MGEAWLSPSAPPGTAPDFPIGFDEILPRLRASAGKGTDGPAAYETLISRALSEVAAHRNQLNPPSEPAFPEAADAPTPNPRVHDFVEALFDQSARRSRTIAETAALNDRDPQKLAASLFEPAARCIGERWIADDSDFVQVTVALSRMQQLFSRIVADSPPAVRLDAARRLLLAPAPGEQHGFGLAIVEDAFARAGWTVDRCGDGERVLQMAAASEYPLIGISIGSEKLLPTLKPLVERLRVASRNRSMVLMGGGGVAIRDPQSVIDAGFDAVATDASSGVRLAAALLASSAKGSHRSAFAH